MSVVELLQVLGALVRSHLGQVARRAMWLAFWTLLLGVLFIMGLVYLLVFATHVLGLLLGETLALAVMLALSALACGLVFGRLRATGRKLVLTHREHVAQEKLAVKAAAVEAVAASKVSGGLAALSAAVAGLLLALIRVLGGSADQQGTDPAPPPDA